MGTVRKMSVALFINSNNVQNPTKNIIDVEEMHVRAAGWVWGIQAPQVIRDRSTQCPQGQNQQLLCFYGPHLSYKLPEHLRCSHTDCQLV